MFKRFVLPLISAVAFLGLSQPAFLAHNSEESGWQTPSAETKTVWDGVYTAAQAARGLAVYEENCARCHGNTLTTNTPSLVGRDFMEKWREDNADSLFNFVRSSMPPRRNRNTERVPLADNQYLDIMSYIFQANSFPEGSQELKPELLEGIRIQGKDGPRPLPNGALARVVGCMKRVDANNWTLSAASEPTRTRTENATAEELKAAAGITPGTRTFRLQNMGYLGSDFNPDSHDGHKMQIKGMLILQPNAERIDIRSVAMVADSCSQ